MERETRRTGEGAGAPAESLYRTIANYTYDWESWLGLDRRLLWVNPAVERLTGYAAAACHAMADYPLPIVHPGDRDLVASHLDAALEGRSANDVEFRVVRLDGTEAWAAVSYQPLRDEQGALLGVRTSVRDITERKRAEQEREAALAEARRADAAKSRFLAAASHDLRQPIQAASWFLAVIEERVRQPELRQAVDALRQCLGSSQSLLDTLLDISRLDAGVIEVERGVVELGDLFEELEVEFAPQARAKGLRLVCVGTSARVESDAVLVRRVLQNFLANAVRYTRSGRVVMGVRRLPGRRRIEVVDTGPGIAPERQEEIFDEFTQIGNPERDRLQGLGLGLSIVRRIADLLGAPCGVRSIPGRGSVFWIELPAVSRAPARELPAGAAGTLVGRRVAVIDDDPAQLAGLAAYLGLLGCEVVAAENVAEILERAGERPAEAVIADYRLRGGATGLDAIGALAAAWGPRPAALLTGDTDPGRLAEARASGLVLLHKPVEPGELRRCLVEMLQGS